MKPGYVYILASQRNGTLYIGVTSDLVSRIFQHRNGDVDGFTKDHLVHLLVHYELHDRIDDAILQEKQLKKWNRSWKVELIEEQNPQWKDLYSQITS